MHQPRRDEMPESEFSRVPTDHTPARVLQAAVQAWASNGEPCEVHRPELNAPGLVAALAATESRRIELLIDDAADESLWPVLLSWPRSESWSVCALVPRPLLGAAHDHLRDGNLELQGWQVADGQVEFGRVELA